MKKGPYSVVLTLLLISPSAWSDTYQVTSPNCGDPGSGGLAYAIQQANDNPGTDTIEIAAGLTISGSCGPLNDLNESALEITESLVIQGNSGLFHGANAYINASTGNTNQIDPGSCPSRSPNFLVIDYSPSLFMIGQFDSDNTGIDVTIEDFSVDSVSQLASVRDGAKLTLRNVNATDVRDLQACTRSVIEAFGDADLVLENVYMKGLNTFDDPRPVGHIQGVSGKLEIYDSEFYTSLGRYAISWKDGDVDIVSSAFTSFGGLFFLGGNMKVVNSLFLPAPLSRDLSFTDGVSALANSEIELTASTFVYSVNECKPPPSLECVYNTDVPTPTFRSGNGSAIVFNQSVLHVQTISPDFSPSATLLLSTEFDGRFSADESSFIQPLEWQDATALKTITNQPLLLTGVDALPVEDETFGFLVFSYPDSVTPIITGDALLVDKIPDAGDGGANELKDPRGNVIAHDVLGNPRVDIGGTRSIGAVQNHVVPYLFAVIDPSDPNTADLSWTTPNSAGITAYDVCYGTGTIPVPGDIGTACPGTLLTNFTDCRSGAPCTNGAVSGLPDAAQVWFLVRATADGTPEPWSEPATVATPVIVSVSPQLLWPPNHRYVDVEVTASAGEVSLISVTSNEPDNGKGDGNTTDDIVILDNGSLLLRAERSGRGSGRIYTITYKVNDGAENVVAVVVPHSQ